MDNTATMRCAVYARYSSDLQRDSSIEDQVRKCREYASRQDGWTIADDYVLYDQAISAASLAGRDALQKLIAAAKERPRPFDRLLIDDTSRLARNIEDSLRVVKILEFNGVHVVAVSQGIDSQNKSARQFLTLHGMMDEQFLVGLADKVHRGQEGRVLQGMVSGGRCFGYRNVAIEDPSKTAKYGRAAVIGVRLEIDEEQAAVVQRVFQMFAEGMSYAKIAKTLNGEGVLSPMPSREDRSRAWCTSSIFEILRNERYHGVQVWNRTKKERNPETGRKVSRPRPESEWKRVEVPEWRIVPEELWTAVQERLKEKNLLFANTSASGYAKHQQYLFSGFLRCGCCGARLVIAAGDGKRAYKKYGCPNYRFRGTCDNKLMIRVDRLEAQLLGYLEENIFTPDMCEVLIRRFEIALQKRISDIDQNSEKYSKALRDLQVQRDQHRAEAERIADAIAAAGHSKMLLDRLAAAESKMAEMQRRIDALKLAEIRVATDEIRDYYSKASADFLSLVGQTYGFTRAKRELAKNLSKLVLTPKQTPEGWVYEVSGDWKLLPEEKCVIWVVARDGIEPPTPAFSGLRSTS